ncbi:endonuclease/exonuclease/phosphatase family protein [Aestuariimicrobium ganziense]|uniref:endonuclease/exonuclease/phosphatase family protein n=1 Tax=Aestuariimicrobium ganziense TaxID=2773677 RepID=UPI0019443C89|nr:endonuclease/exonuclease/phosphatase family protein [Aestuariimicrobium ganziense]
MSSLQVMSFNLRVPVESHGPGHPDHWHDRLPAIVEVLRERRPHLVGTQEGVWPQLRVILDELPHYGLIGTGRDGGSRAEYSAILYDRERFDLESWDQWWLSPTPTHVGSVGWGASCTRIAVIADLLDRASGQVVTMVNTHLDHVSDEARTEGARSIVDRLGAATTPPRAAIVTGDFNCAGGASEAWRVLTEAGLDDTWLVAAEREGEGLATFHGYSEPSADPAGQAQIPPTHLPGSLGQAVRIDWVLASPDWKVERAELVLDRPAGVWPSDHWPLAATLTRA